MHYNDQTSNICGYNWDLNTMVFLNAHAAAFEKHF